MCVIPVDLAIAKLESARILLGPTTAIGLLMVFDPEAASFLFSILSPPSVNVSLLSSAKFNRPYEVLDAKLSRSKKNAGPRTAVAAAAAVGWSNS